MSVNPDAESLKEKFSDGVLSMKEFRGESTVVVELAKLREVLEYCVSSLGYGFLLDVASVDHLGEEPRYEVLYELESVDAKKHLRVKAPVGEDEEVPTAVDLWATANWLEREVYDLMGLRFCGHPDLKRILMWDGYPYHPLRKDFPLAGKETEMPDVAFTGAAPMEGGPFVTSPCDGGRHSREPRSKA